MLIFVLVLGTAAATLGWGYRDYARTTLEHQLRELQVLNSAAAARVTQVARLAERQVVALSRETGFRAAAREAARDHAPEAVARTFGELEQLMEADPSFVKLQLYDVSGLPVSGLHRRGGVIEQAVELHAYISEPEALELARRAPVGDARLVGPIVERGTDGTESLLLQVAAPVMDSRGIRVGVVFAAYAIDGVVEDIRADVRQRLGAADTSLVLVDLYGRALGDPFAAELAGRADPVRAMLDRAPGHAAADWLDFESGREGVAAAALRYMAPDPGRYSFVALAVVEQMLLARARSEFIGRLTASLIFALGAILLALVYARGLVRPLEQLLHAARRFGAGEAVGDLPTARRDEVGRLSAAFAEMIHQVSRRKTELESEIGHRERTEEALRDKAQRLEVSEANYRQLYESVAAGVCVASADGRVLSANPAFVRMLGYVSESQLRQEMRHADVWLGPGPREDYLRMVRQEGELNGVELQLRRRDGHVVWVLENTRAVWNEAGEAIAYESTLVDISDRKRAEQAMRTNELRFRRLSDSNLIGVAFGSLAGGMLTEANRYTLSLLDYETNDLPLKLDELLGADWVDIIERVRATGRLRQPLKPFEKSLRRRDGTLVPVFVNVTLVDAHGDEFVAAIIDRSAAVESLRRVRDLKEFFRLVLDSIPTRIAYVDIDLQVRFFNRAYLEWYGFGAEEVEGRPLFDVIGRDSYLAALPEMRRALAGEFRRFEASVERDGRAVYADIAYVPHRDADGRVLGFFSVVHDVTEARELEARLRQSQKLEALGQLTGGIAHDFNNLLSVVIGNLQLFERQGGGDDRARRPVSAALRAALRGADLTRRLLSFSRRQPLELRVLDLREQVAALREMLGRTLGASVTVHTDLPEDLWPVELDAGQLESAMLNLAINARDAMEGDGRLSICARNVFLAPEDLRLEEDAQPGEFVSLTIADTGCGMDADVQARVFEPFFTTKPTGKGSGLGLAMVYGFVRQAGGVVRLESRTGEGTVFELLFPRTRRTVDGRAEPAACATAGGSETVLVVEDDPDLRETACSILAAAGYRTLAAADGAAALALLDLHPEVSLLFTDVVMPGPLNGLQLAEEATRRRPQLRTLLTTGFSGTRELQGDVLDKYVLLLKPYLPEDVARRVREALDSRGPPQADAASA